MSDPTDDPRFDEVLSEVFADEARRVRPAPDAWARIGHALGRPPRSGQWLVAGAAVVLLLAGGATAVALLTGDGDGDSEVQVGTDPTNLETTTTESPTTSTTEAESSTTTAPEVGVVVDPIEIGPLPPPRGAPPETIAAVTVDGRLVLVDTTTGAVTREIAEHGDLRDDPGEGGPSGIDGVALSPSGDRVWFSVCCEPAAGSLHEQLLDPDATPIRPAPPVPEQPTRFADAYAPAFSPSDRWATTATYWASIWDLQERERRDWSRNDGGGFSWAALSPDGQSLVVVPWSTTGERGGRLEVIATDRTTVPNPPSPGVEAVRQIVAEPRELAGDGWVLPTFARDGRLLAAQESDDGSWAARLIDIDTGETADASIAYGGVPLSQDHDATGEWLVYVVSESDDSLEGTIHWTGPDGQVGTIPGSYYAASW